MKKLKPLAEFVKQYPSQEKAAAAIGVSFPTLNRWLNGRGSPRGDVMRNHLESLGIDVSEI